MSKKTVKTTIETREDLESVFGEYAALFLEKKRLDNELDRELLAVRARYEKPSADLVTQADGLFEDLQAWAALHPEAFAARKSIDLLHGTLGFRTSPPSVRQMRGVKAGHTLAAIAAKGWSWLIRTKVEIDKDAVLASRASKPEENPQALSSEELSTVGLLVDQDETFYCEVTQTEE